MGIKKLKKENDFLNITLIDMLGKFDNSKTKKYTQLLVKLLNKKIEQHESNNDYLTLKSGEGLQTNPIDRVLPRNCWENFITRSFICDYVFSWSDMERFVEFTELMEKNLIPENDISKYDSWEMLEINLFESKNREMFKKSKKEIHKIYEDEKYLILKPLTYMSSCSYGYQTKWCTAMINDATYFYNHSRGILIYLINKETNVKFAFYKHCPDYFELEHSEHENYVFKTYNQEDKQIDTIQTGLPSSILEIILRETNLDLPTTKPNYKLFSEEEKNEMKKYNGKLPDDDTFGGEKMLSIADDVTPLIATERILRPLTRDNLGLTPTRAFEPHGEDEVPVMEETIVEVDTEKYLEEAKLSLEISREELEKQILEHLIQQDNEQG